MSAGQIVETLKANGEDFEWYPTTQEIVDRLAVKIFSKREWGEGEYECDYGSVLDIGCGNGSFFEKIDRTDQQKFNATALAVSRKQAAHETEVIMDGKKEEVSRFEKVSGTDGGQEMDMHKFNELFGELKNGPWQETIFANLDTRYC
ncbi:MAG: hypothetical protein II837_10390, partial [Treponema sp.]|nr:hypothetical protein [Treponema sp.]